MGEQPGLENAGSIADSGFAAKRTPLTGLVARPLYRRNG